MSGLKDSLLGDEIYVPSSVPEARNRPVYEIPALGLALYQSHSSTSHAAARSIAKHIGPLHQKIIAYLTDHPEGATDEQLIDATGINPSTLRPRRIELQNRQIVADSKRHSLTRSGRRATVWVLAST